jgi:hypothetical protein
MLTGTGRIIVAIAGAVALVVAGVFIVRGLLSSPSPTPKNTSKSSIGVAMPAPPPSGPAPVDPGVDPGADPGASTSGGSTDPSGGSSAPPNNGSTTGASNSEPNPSGPVNPSPPFTATTTKAAATIGLVAVDAVLPQVQGGTENVAQTFNNGLQSALQTEVDTLPKGKFQGDARSGVRIGTQVLSGLVHGAYTPGTSSTPIAKAATVVVDTKSNSVLDVATIFTDQTTGLKRLQTESKKLGPTTSTAGGTFMGTNLQADQTTFSHWTAETTGMKLYFEQGVVAPPSQGVVELTIPWVNLQDVLKPGVLQTLSS